MAVILKFLAALPGALTAVEKIFTVVDGLLQRYFPAKTEGERALEKRAKQVKKAKEATLEKNKAVKDAKRGHTKKLEDIVNNPK